MCGMLHFMPRLPTTPPHLTLVAQLAVRRDETRRVPIEKSRRKQEACIFDGKEAITLVMVAGMPMPILHFVSLAHICRTFLFSSASSKIAAVGDIAVVAHAGPF